MTIEEAINSAFACHRAGNLPETHRLCQLVLSHAPDHPDALHLLGLLALQSGNSARAIELIQRAVEIAPGRAQYYKSLGNALLSAGRGGEAVAPYRESLRLDPRDPDAWWKLGNCLRIGGDPCGAIAAAREALRLRPGDALGHLVLGVSLAQKAELQEAVTCFREAVRLGAGAIAQTNLCSALRETGQINEAVALGTEIVARRPGDAEGWTNLGLALEAQRNFDPAIHAFRRAVAIPGPHLALAWGGLTNALMACGEHEEALASFGQVVGHIPRESGVHSNYLYALHFDPRLDARALFHAHQKWAQKHASPLAQAIRPHGCDRDKARRLRVGYLSADFHGHSVARFMLPLLKAHAQHGEGLALYFYSDVRVPDLVTSEFRKTLQQAGGTWRDIQGLSDAVAADLVRGDQVDILVDLGMHSGRSRILVFACKPAPVQVTYLAYPGTTGLDTIDWRFTDVHIDPPASPGQLCDKAPLPGLYSERNWRLRTFWCYEPPPAAQDQEVSGLPSLERGYITFGCLNNPIKLTRPVIETCGRILLRVPHARLTLLASSQGHRERILRQLADLGVTSDRVSFLGIMPMGEYLSAYRTIDVALDPFPYAGGTSTCDALWMGIPVVALLGKTAVGRGSASILSTIGLEKLVAADVEHYVTIASQLAGDRHALAEIRAAMRERMRNSPLMDMPAFVREVEAAYRTMWHDWCDRFLPPKSGNPPGL